MGKPKARRKAKKARYKATTQEDKIVKAAHADKEDAPSPSDTASSGSPTFTLDQLLSKCQDLLDCYDYDLAQKFVHRALEMDPDCVRALEYAATLLIEAGDVENARHCLGRAVTVEPDSGHRKYFSLAQIMSGKEALQLYQKGIDIIAQEQKRKDGKAADAVASDLKRELSNGFCAVAELYMTDLCDEDGAQGECESHVARAVGSDEGNPEAWQTKARLSLVMEQFEDAKESARKSLSLWLPKFEAVRQNKASTTTGEDEAAAAAAAATVVDPVEVCPLLYTTRISTAKLLIELEMLDKATQVLEGLVDEDDEVVETWYLLGWLNRIRSTTEDEAGYDGNVRFYLGKAKEVHKKNPTDDADMVRHIDEILAEVGPGESNKDEEEEGWEDVESSGEEDENGDGEDGKMDET